MTEYLLSSEIVERVNDRVREKIADHLFIFCDYHPHITEVFGPDALFIIAIEDFYKLLVDAGIYHSLKDMGKNYHIRYNHRELKRIYEIVCKIRTAISHNTPPNSLEVVEYKEWLRDECGVAEITSAQDYVIPYETIMEYVGSIEGIIGDFIDSAATSSQLDDIISEWENQIKKFYTKHSSVQVYKTEMVSVMEMEGVFYTKDYDLASWTESYYFSSYALQRSLMDSRYLTQEQREQITEYCDGRKQAMLAAVKRVNPKYNATDAFLCFNYMTLVVLPLIAKDRIDGKKYSETLLPQDLVQEILTDLHETDWFDEFLLGN